MHFRKRRPKHHGQNDGGPPAMSALCYPGTKLAEINQQNSEHDQECHDAYLSILTSTFFCRLLPGGGLPIFREVFLVQDSETLILNDDADFEKSASLLSQSLLDEDRNTARQFHEAKLDGPGVIIGKPPELDEFVRRILSQEFPEEVEATPTAAWVQRVLSVKCEPFSKYQNYENITPPADGIWPLPQRGSA